MNDLNDYSLNFLLIWKFAYDETLKIEVLGGFEAWFEQNFETFECPPMRLMRASIYRSLEEV